MQKIIEKYHQEFSHIVICGVEKHDLQNHFPEGFVTVSREIIDPAQYQVKENDPILFVIDDAFMEAINLKIVLNSFTKGRHDNISSIILTQNVFAQGKQGRSITLNASHIILTKNRDICQVETLFRQIFEKKKKGRRCHRCLQEGGVGSGIRLYIDRSSSVDTGSVKT